MSEDLRPFGTVLIDTIKSIGGRHVYAIGAEIHRDRENGAGFSFDFENLAISHNDGDEDQPDSYSGWLLTVNYRPDGALEGWNYRMLVNPGETEEWAADSQVPEEHKAEIIEDLKYALNTIENMIGVRLDETNGPALPETTSETQEN